MFYRAKIEKVNGVTADVSPLLEDRNGKYQTVRDIPILHYAGGDFSINYNYKPDDVVVVALTGFPMSEKLVNHDLMNQSNFSNSVIIGKIVGESKEGASIKYNKFEIDVSDDNKVLIKNDNTDLTTIVGLILTEINLIKIALKSVGAAINLQKTPLPTTPEVSEKYKDLLDG